MIPTPSKSEIHLLPEHIVDQIKAGEVIERPATLIKELIENSIDAKATKIDIHVINNGLDLISIIDNGSGISFDDLPMAFCRHATSKIELFEDLYKLHSYGFRGEALASMASVSKITCISQKQGTPEGFIQFHGGEIISHHKETSPQEESGTKIFVKDLFYNTPARMKFLQSQTSEKNQLKKIIHAFILTHPEIEFSVRFDDGDKEFYPITNDEDYLNRVKKLFEKKNDPLELIQFQEEYDGIQVKVVISHNMSKGNTGKFQYIFINDRFVQDTQIHKIILNSAQSLWPFGMSGNYLVFISVSPDQLDVNVHPNKTIVKLFQPSKIFSLLSSSIKKHLPQSSRLSSFTPNNQSMLTMPDETQNIDFKNIHYREQDFTSEASLDDYFRNLDQVKNFTEESDSQFKFILKDNSVLLIEKNKDILLINHQKLLIAYINDLLLNNKDWSSIPLLVSSPLAIKRKIDPSLLEVLLSYGFEIDALSPEILVLRSFPKVFSHLPYDQILNALLESKATKDTCLKLAQETILNFNSGQGLIEKILSHFSIPDLIRFSCLKKIEPKDLLKLI